MKEFIRIKGHEVIVFGVVCVDFEQTWHILEKLGMQAVWIKKSIFE